MQTRQSGEPVQTPLTRGACLACHVPPPRGVPRGFEVKYIMAKMIAMITTPVRIALSSSPVGLEPLTNDSRAALVFGVGWGSWLDLLSGLRAASRDNGSP